MNRPLEVLSLGAGVQSSTLALMSEAGVLPKLDAAVFADTESEPRAVYEYLSWLIRQVSFPIIVAKRWQDRSMLDAEGTRRVSKKTGRRYVGGAVPLWVFKDGKSGGGLQRRCTGDFKIEVVHRELRRLLNMTGRTMPAGVAVREWIGISTDEVDRAKPSRKHWIQHVFPLLDHKVSRANCLDWCKSKGYREPPRSACVFCPFHAPIEWDNLQANHPDDYQRAVDYEDHMRAAYREHNDVFEADDVFLQYVVPGRPLSDINWSEVLGKGQLSLFDLMGGWSNECEGMCGL